MEESSSPLLAFVVVRSSWDSCEPFAVLEVCACERIFRSFYKVRRRPAINAAINQPRQ